MKSLLQTKEWCDFRVSQGWQAHNVDGIFILERKLPFGKSFLYAPEVTWEQVQSSQVIASLAPLGMQQSDRSPRPAFRQVGARDDTVIFFRLEILDEFDPSTSLGAGEKIVEKLKKFGFIKAFEELQPEYRQVVDISKPEEEILAQMKEKGRYNIKIAQRNNIVIKNSKNIGDFYRIFQETAKRDGFSIRPKEYFEKMFEILGADVELLYAEFQGKIIAAEIVSFYDETASYLYGASSGEFRNIMAPYLLHWEAIKKAKNRGCKFYDLLAVAPEGVEEHKYAGISRFKRQFGGKTVHIIGSYDYVYKPVWYKLFKMAEKHRRK